MTPGTRSLLEIACFSPEALLVAAKAGAHRLEYCSSYANGGCSPHPGSLEPIRPLLPCPVRVMIRCRGGDFVYTGGELLAMRNQLRCWADEGADGWVAGCLTPSGMPDVEGILSIQQGAPGLPLTFHRAFDRCTDPLTALDMLINMGCTHLLTAGIHPGGASEGTDCIRQYCDYAGQRIRIMAGGGIRRHNISRIFGVLGASADYHSAAVVASDLGMNDGDPLPDPLEVKEMINILL